MRQLRIGRLHRALRRLFSGFALALMVAGIPLTAPAGERDEGFSEIVVFGASVSDVGNVNILTAGSSVFIPFTQPPYFQGRFSNGPLWHEVMAEQLGVPAASTPSLIGGNNFAFGGAEVGPGGSFLYGLPNLGVQIDWYLTGIDPFTGSQTRPPASPSGDQLFVVASGGGNNLVPPGAPQDPEAIVAFIEEHITTLAEAGGRHFLVPNFFDIENAPFLTPGLLDPLLYPPGIQTEADAAEIIAHSVETNRRLRPALRRLEQRLNREFGDVTIVTLDKFRIARFIKQVPHLFGIEDVTSQALTPPFIGCFCTGVEADDPNAFFWYDSLHPTETVHQVWGNLAASAVAKKLRKR
ncbi:MAG: SGNH/GDSL hydrolase family protein [Gammaproteobacteria bacterium]